MSVPAAASAGAGPDRAAAFVADVDVVVVGAGVVGCAVARELAGRAVRVALIDARRDVGDVTSKANTAILHTGFDAKPGTLEARLVRAGHGMLGDYARRAGIAVERTGALLIAWTAEQAAELAGLAARARISSVATEPVDPAGVYAREPHAGPGALGGLLVPEESIIDPWSTTLAYATEALARGARLLLGRRVTGVDVGPRTTVLRLDRGAVRARWVVNAAGLGADTLDHAFGYHRFTVTPRRGQLIVFDKLARPLVNHVLLPVPGPTTKGVLISPTVFGNVMLGPTAEDLSDRADTATTRAGLDGLMSAGARILPDLVEEDVTATYAGLRAATEHGDYLVEVDAAARYLCLGGIRSTGLTASLALAAHAATLLAGAGLELPHRGDLPDTPRMPPLGEASLRPYADARLIAEDPAYGELVCFCERVSAGEVRDALASPCPPRELDGLARRTRATNGRCQGFACGAHVAALLAGAER